MLFGLPPVLDAGRDTLPLFLQMYDHPSYVADQTIVYGTQVENTDLLATVGTRAAMEPGYTYAALRILRVLSYICNRFSSS